MPSLGSGLFLRNNFKCILQIIYLHNSTHRRHASSVTQQITKQFYSDPYDRTKLPQGNPHVRKKFLAQTSTTPRDPIHEDKLVPISNENDEDEDDGSFTAFRGIMARAGVNLPLGLGNNFKPDPLLRHQITVENQNEVLTATMTPLVQLSYDDQLRFKWERNKQLMRNLSKQISRKIPNIHLDDGLVCPVDMVVPSPVLSKFRNKDELSVSVGVDGYPKKVGYFVGKSRDNTILCVNPSSIICMKDSHKHLGNRFEEYLEMSDYDYARVEPNGYAGHWKGIIARSNRKGDLMAIVVFHPQSLTIEELKEEKDQVANFFQNGPGKDCELKSLYWQSCPNSYCSPVKYPFELLFGEEYIIETIGEKKFRISPSAFFQLNPDAMEVMYDKVAELLRPNPDSVLLDVCCGAGTIGLSLASKFDKVLGVEKDLMAVCDADHNMGLNNIKNATFYCGSAEKLIPKLLKDKEFTYSNVSAVVNPGRGGLEISVIKALRTTPQVDRVVYVSCQPIGNAMRNLTDLCLPTSKNLPGEAFFPTRAIPVDMFPHTDHCELLILFERNRIYFV